MTSPKLMKALVRSTKGSGHGIAWVVPALMLAVIAVIFVTAFSSVIFSSVNQPLSDRDVNVQDSAHRNPAEKFKAQPPLTPSGQAVLNQRRRMQMPYYIKCFVAPTFQSGPLKGACDVLHAPRTTSLVHPTQQFREQATIQIDVSSCGFYLNSTAVGKPVDMQDTHAMDLMQPFEVQLRPNSTDHDVFLQVYCGYDFNFMVKLAQYIPVDRDLTVLDAGTNVGLAAILFAQLIKFSGEVMAVDANPATMKVMKANTDFLGAVVTPIEAAIVAETVADNTSTLTFVGMSDQYWGFRVDHNNWQHPQRVSYEVQTRSLPQLKEMARAGRFDLIKLDIEGEEKHILADGASRAVLCEALCIFMELHDRFEPGCSDAFNAFLQAGCGGGGGNFEHVSTTGEYMLYCKASAYSVA